MPEPCHRRLSRTLGPLGLLVLAAVGPIPAQGIDPETRIDGLEARLEGLTQRVQALETLLKESGPGKAAVAVPKGEPIWELDHYSREDPFQVIQRSLDRETGRVDLLLSVAAPIPDLADWVVLVKGDPVPLLLTPDLGDGQAINPLPLRLERATRLESGSRLHVGAQLEPSLAKRIQYLRVGHRAPGAAPQPRAESDVRPLPGPGTFVERANPDPGAGAHDRH